MAELSIDRNDMDCIYRKIWLFTEKIALGESLELAWSTRGQGGFMSHPYKRNLVPFGRNTLKYLGFRGSLKAL